MFRTKRIKATVRPTLRITTCLLAVLCVAGSRSSAQDATSHPPTIVSATADFAVQPPQLTITGTYFGSSKPTVNQVGHGPAAVQKCVRRITLHSEGVGGPHDLDRKSTR